MIKHSPKKWMIWEAFEDLRIRIVVQHCYKRWLVSLQKLNSFSLKSNLLSEWKSKSSLASGNQKLLGHTNMLNLDTKKECGHASTHTTTFLWFNGINVIAWRNVMVRKLNSHLDCRYRKYRRNRGSSCVLGICDGFSKNTFSTKWRLTKSCGMQSYFNKILTRIKWEVHRSFRPN